MRVAGGAPAASALPGAALAAASGSDRRARRGCGGGVGPSSWPSSPNVRVYSDGRRPGAFAPHLEEVREGSSPTRDATSARREGSPSRTNSTLPVVYGALPATPDAEPSGGSSASAGGSPTSNPWSLPSLQQTPRRPAPTSVHAYVDASGAARTSVPALALACDRLHIPCARDDRERRAFERGKRRPAALRWFANPDEAANFLATAAPHEACARLPGLARACAKAPFARLVNAARVLAAADGKGDALAAVPRTWVLPSDWRALKEAIAARELRTPRIIVKPSRGSQGDGIAVVDATEAAVQAAVSQACLRGMEASLTAWARSTQGKDASNDDETADVGRLGLPVDLNLLRGAAPTSGLAMGGGTSGDDEYVVQEFVDPPLTVDGRKFDLRLYAALVTGGGQPARAYMCRDGLARLCVDPVDADEGSKSPSKGRQAASALLTNTALNKKLAGYSIDHDDVTGGTGAKRSARAALATAAAQASAGGSKSADVLWAHATKCVAEACELLLTAAQTEHAAAAARDDGRDAVCTHVIGLDVMFDENGRCVLLEANASPSWVLDVAEDIPESALGIDEPPEEPPRRASKRHLPRLDDSSRTRAERIRHRTRLFEASARLGPEVCHCKDSERPHVHVPSPVDEATKALALCGAFELAFARVKGVEPSNTGWVRMAYDLVYEYDGLVEAPTHASLLRSLGHAAQALLERPSNAASSITAATTAAAAAPSALRARRLARKWAESLVHRDASRARAHADVAVARWKAATRVAPNNPERPLLLLSALTLLREVSTLCGSSTPAGLRRVLAGGGAV